ncbi:type VI secretion system ATPase TssH [Zooshikella harenae]|uniref:Type VI secretion system ATPase TssH n=1 Tax=Zooshikella harenae TaxID=2827238 RepID=A0ABS5Z942_9GAMM|nr:type VI secretion system ATPase TssH [Zooshikella harenae]MBU2710567.1 type VI secretion system ATPase TssH [Zooshikella harenae]
MKLDLNLLISHLNPESRTAIESAASRCVARQGFEITVEDVLLELLAVEEGEIQKVLKHYEIESSRLEKALQHEQDMRGGHNGRPVFSQFLQDWLQEAFLLATVELKMDFISPGILLCTVLDNELRFSRLAYYKVLSTIPTDELKQLLQGADEENKSPVSKPLSSAGDQQSVLEKYTINFTEHAKQGKIDPVFCRENEIRQMVDVLSRRRKNNPIIVGEPGVGKSAVVEGLALKIVEGDVPAILKDVTLLGLDMGLLQAGASVKGEFEKRLKGVIEAIQSSVKPIILFIDEAHTLIGAGNQAGGGDAANLLKPALARGDLRTIAATTWSEYKKYFEKDPALARRFQLVKLEEPNAEQAAIILRGLKGIYEKNHGVYIRDDAVVAAAQLSERYISGRQLPDKAIDVIDTACARVKVSMAAKPAQVEDQLFKQACLQREFAGLERDKKLGVKYDSERYQELQALLDEVAESLVIVEQQWQEQQQQVTEILELRQKLRDIQHHPEGMQSEGQEEQASQNETGSEDRTEEDVPLTIEDAVAEPSEDVSQLLLALEEAEQKLGVMQEEHVLVSFEVDPEVIAQVISAWTGIPASKMLATAVQGGVDFVSEMTSRVKGQDHAVAEIDKALKAAKVGLNNPDTPMGVFLLVGPSGVGKTETALNVADLCFGGERFMTTINMSEFQEKHTVSRLVGSPPGYVGYGEGGVLTEAVRQRPYSVVLLDEVEKADLEVMNLFYQVFDKGTLSDGEGREIDFKNTLVFMTSNLASDIICDLCQDGKYPSQDELAKAVRPVLSAHFKPALLARMKIVPFFPIASDVMAELVELKLSKLNKRIIQQQKLALSYDPELLAQMAARCTEVEAGARNIDQLINGGLLPKISDCILRMDSDQHAYTKLHVSLNQDLAFVVTPA